MVSAPHSKSGICLVDNVGAILPVTPGGEQGACCGYAPAGRLGAASNGMVVDRDSRDAYKKVDTDSGGRAGLLRACGCPPGTFSKDASTRMS
jgi:hypothetical protein